MLTATRGRGETYIVLQISSSRYMPTGKYLMIKVTTRYFSTWFDPSRTLTNSKGSITQRHEHDENLTTLDRVSKLIRSWSRIQQAGFSREGHGTQMQKMHGHSKSQVSSGGHMDPAQPQNFCPNPWDSELWVAYINHKVENTQYRKSTYLQSIFRFVVIIHTQSYLTESARTETPWSADV